MGIDSTTYVTGCYEDGDISVLLGLIYVCFPHTLQPSVSSFDKFNYKTTLRYNRG